MNPSNDDTVRLYRAANEPEAHMLKMELEAAGIQAIVEGGTLQWARGEVPPSPDTLPSVRILERDLPAAQPILESFIESKAPENPLEEWTCPACGETAGGQFALCWNCQAERPDASEGFTTEDTKSTE